LFVNLANTVSEFAGVAASMEIFGVSKYISVPIAAVLVWLLIVKGNYKVVERVFLVASAIYLAYIASGVIANPDWAEVGQALTTPTFHLDVGYVTIFVTIIGTTIAPWMQFYQQSSIVDKGLQVKDYAYERVDVIVGSLFAVVVATFITIACASTIYKSGLSIESAKDAALALGPLAGKYASTLFALGLLNASLFSAAIRLLHFSMRSFWLGEQHRPRFERCTHLLWHIHGFDYLGGRHHFAAHPVPDPGYADQPDLQRCTPAGHPDHHARVDQRQALDG
jgi:Mn2+/Fe2+ NRAMP family transporter